MSIGQSNTYKTIISHQSIGIDWLPPGEVMPEFLHLVRIDPQNRYKKKPAA
jgi:hypothetical protein